MLETIQFKSNYTGLPHSSLLATGEPGWDVTTNTLYIGNNGVNVPIGGGGSVVSVGLSAPPEITVTGSPVSGSGTIALTWANEAVGTFFAGPAAGGSATPGFRAIVAADVPLIPASKIGSGVFPVSRGGTGTDGSITGPGAVYQQFSGSVLSSGILPQTLGGTGANLGSNAGPGVIQQLSQGGVLSSDLHLTGRRW